MLRSNQFLHARSGRALAAVTVYLVTFAALLVVISHFYLLPAMRVRQHADPAARKVMALHALLLMMLLLFFLLLGLVITFRMGRHFRPRASTPNKPTKYVDAWAESGRRIQIPKDEELEE